MGNVCCPGTNTEQQFFENMKQDDQSYELMLNKLQPAKGTLLGQTKPNPNEVLVVLRTFTNDKTITLSIGPQHTVKELKQRVEAVDDIAQKRMFNLILGQKPMSESSKLVEFKLTKESVIKILYGPDKPRE